MQSGSTNIIQSVGNYNNRLPKTSAPSFHGLTQITPRSYLNHFPLLSGSRVKNNALNPFFASKHSRSLSMIFHLRKRCMPSVSEPSGKRNEKRIDERIEIATRSVFRR